MPHSSGIFESRYFHNPPFKQSHVPPFGFLALRLSFEKDSHLTQETHISLPFITEIKAEERKLVRSTRMKE
jgi:hypothetical protein